MSGPFPGLNDEAYAQGGVLSELDLSLVTGYTDGGVSAAVMRLRKAGEILPIRGYVADMGSWPTHKATIIRLYLEGLTTPEIASRTYHSKRSVDRYIEVSNGRGCSTPNAPARNYRCSRGWRHGWWRSMWRFSTNTTWADPCIGVAGWVTMGERDVAPSFVVARNPEEGSRLGFLVRLPLPEGDVLLKAADSWPRTAKLYCHPADWPEMPQILEEVPVRSCRRRGMAIDLVLERPRENRAQFVFTTARGRDVIFWQSPKTTARSRPGVRVPTRRASGFEELTILIDTRERYPYRFTRQQATTQRKALPAGDYGVALSDEIVAVVERKSVADLARRLVDGNLTYALASWPPSSEPPLSSRAATPSCSSSTTSPPASSPNSWHGCKSATPASPSSSATAAHSPRNGPSASSVPPSPISKPNTTTTTRTDNESSSRAAEKPSRRDRSQAQALDDDGHYQQAQ